MPFTRRRSLAVTIPLLTALLLLAALGAMSVASYLELRSALIEMARGRLEQAAVQMANVFAMSARQRIAAMKQLMQLPEIRDYVRTGDASKQPAIEAAIKSHLGPAIEYAGVELWDANGKRMLAVGDTFEELTAPLIDEYKQELQALDDAAIGHLRLFADGLRYPIGGRLSDNGEVIGYVVERRRISNPAQTRQTIALLTGLIGNQATMVIGNADGSSWSDLARTITDLPVDVANRRLAEYQRAGMSRTFAWAQPIASTPWAVAIEFPVGVVLEPSRRFVLRSLLIGVVVLLFATIAGWIATRGITTSLRHVTEGAEAVAESRPHVHVDIDREDEIGRLADAFNVMAEKVEQGRTELETRVEQRTAELSAANRELEAFSYSVSHDLRAPLRAIAGFVQILEEDHAAALDATAKRHLDRVKVNAQRMGKLIDDLLSFSRIGRSAMNRQTFDLTAMVTSVANEAIAASGRKIELSISPLPPCYGEAALLNQVFVNLVGNAVKFSARAAEPRITIGTTDAGGETAYFVRDNGVGFDERYAEKLFGVFQRLHRADEFEGTGVGLAIVHRIVTRHGGRVWAEGKINGGATFYFTLPDCKPS
jgi:signal transduction histidine kinase